MGSESIAIDWEPIRARGIIVNYSEETETDFSIWIPTEISGIFGIMASTQDFGLSPNMAQVSPRPDFQAQGGLNFYGKSADGFPPKSDQ